MQLAVHRQALGDAQVELEEVHCVGWHGASAVEAAAAAAAEVVAAEAGAVVETAAAAACPGANRGVAVADVKHGVASAAA